MQLNRIELLINAFRCLPGVGPKTAQRMTYQILERKREDGLQLAIALQDAINNVGYCKGCRTLTDTEFCPICANPNRDPTSLCIVETPADVLAIEQTHTYSGLYFVLMGHLSPLDGIGPQELGMNELSQKLHQLTLKELIIATNPTMEGEITANYIANMTNNLTHLKCTRIAYGVPMGGELEYIDGNTLTKALVGRQLVRGADE